jgi:hypothetical protein
MTTTTAEIDRDNRDFYEGLAAEAFEQGEIADGLYFMDAADYWAEAPPEVAAAREGLLLGAMGDLTESRSRQ